MARCMARGSAPRRLVLAAAAAAAAATGYPAARAHACSIAGNQPHAVDPAEQAVDTTAPGGITVENVVFDRRGQAGCGETTSCDGVSVIELSLHATDDRTPLDDMGIEIALVSGELPPGRFGLPETAVRVYAGGVVYLPWTGDAGRPRATEPGRPTTAAPSRPVACMIGTSTGRVEFMRRWAQGGWLAIAVTLSAGCSDGPCFLDAGLPCSVCESVTEPASLEIGGAASPPGFLAMQDGDEMTVLLSVTPPYLGIYVLTPSIRARGVYPGEAGRSGDAEDPQVLIELFLQTELIGGSARERLGLTVTAEGAERLQIVAGFLGDRSTFIDQLVTIRGEITDVCGNTATDELDVLVVD